MGSKPTTVEEYIASFPDEVRPRLRELRALSRTNAPDATEGLKWGDPAYSLGTILFIFSGHRKHANVVFTPSTLNAFSGELVGFETGKGSVKIPYDRSVPTRVLGEMIAYRIREYEVDGVNWM